MSALNDAADLHDELFAQVSDRTREILERRNRRVVRNRGWLVRRLLAAADVIGLLAAMLLAEWIVTTTTGAGAIPVRDEVIALIATLPGWIVVAKLYGLYDRDEERADHSTADEFAAVFNMVTVCTWLFWALSRVTHVVYPTPPKLIIFWATAIIFVTLGRALARTLARRNVAYLQNTIIVGAGDIGQLVARKLLQHREYGINLVGFVDAQPRKRREDLGHLAGLGGPDRLPALVRMFDVERVIVAFSNESHEAELQIVRSLDNLGVQIDIVPRLFEIVGPNAEMHLVEGMPVMSLRPMHIPRSSRLLKRAADVVVSGIALVLTAPLFAFVAWRIRREDGGPVFFRQTRLGMDMREFTMLKFRTMHVGTGSGEHEEHVRLAMAGVMAPERSGLFKLERVDAITRTGRWLRRTSLDELPQLINVLFGDMSLVGPRPCLPYETESFLPHHFDRFAVPAGITGMWQAMARAHATFREALDMDVAYVRGWSLRLDLRLFCRTPLQMLRPKETR